MFGRSVQRILLPLSSFTKTNFNRSQLQAAKQYGKHKRQNQQFNACPKVMISASILGWLGLEKQPEKVDENHKGIIHILRNHKT